MLVLFTGTALLTGRAWRFAYDVENFYFDLSHLTLLQKLNFGDIHSPLPLIFFTELRRLGLSDSGIHLVSLAATGVALALIQFLTFALMEKSGEIPLHIRFLAIILFALAPLALGMGDSIRWYPLFALVISLFVTAYLAGGNVYWRLGAGALLGAAASVDFLAIFVAIPFSIYRYGLERQFRARFDIPFWGLSGAFGSVGLWAFYGVATHPVLSTEGLAQFAYKPATAVAENLLGFFGGNAIGIGQIWAVLPAAIITLIAGVSLIDKRSRGAPVHLFLLMLCAPIAMTAGGFSEPRVFIYLAPVAVALQLLYLRVQNANLVLVCGTALLAAALGTAINLYHVPAPFKRETSIPHNSVMDFVRVNEKGATLVITTDEILADALSRDPSQARCISFFFESDACFNASRHYDTIFIIYGYSAVSDAHQNIYFTGGSNFTDKLRLLPSAVTDEIGSQPSKTAQETVAARQLAQWIGGRKPVVTIHFGEDADAALKSRLTHTHLDSYLLTADMIFTGE